MGLPIGRKVFWLEASHQRLPASLPSPTPVALGWVGRRFFAWHTPLAKKRWPQRDELVGDLQKLVGARKN